MTIAYIGLGSNLSEPAKQVQQAVAAISNIANSQIQSVSSVYLSKPMGPQDQDDYINAVLALETKLSAIELLDTLQSIENSAGRVRKENRWGARILDLDIILYGNEVIENERLTVPHYGMKEREFVLLPLAEITEDLYLPSGESVNSLAQGIATNGMIKQGKLSY
ncbi:2-amino-4-hydroxy-6-hydroxymethyldihydropteridine diphosphokinase [Litorilituus sediminis]|uniref:2-amino-4-hydroxy-6-hydroxymethyldihydropteridine pyrophosphokinase n=1 Tax=Litorilituus sediminis TaxID=718192 RepID=A0A4P6P6E3_9GAMM|nr:2-amino-4-hydroxy-6-hydroxymethyldihydropteridine diphosphokinase [Litorilituus sediminis]QBG35749.1 2-amino-4-hydroxy-6-hydroxymethyldihydropteridine diphosphokinase [Litorilituus sediminis]